MRTKKCPKCKIAKQLDEFSYDRTRKDGKAGTCKECVKIYTLTRKKKHQEDPEYRKKRNESRFASSQARKQKKKDLVNSYKAVPCADCKNTYIPWVMEFDHRVPSEKRDNVSAMCDDNYSLVALTLEISKCDVVCANCHRIREYNRYHKGTLKPLESIT